jgi:hypothetical protein
MLYNTNPDEKLSDQTEGRAYIMGNAHLLILIVQPFFELDRFDEP